MNETARVEAFSDGVFAIAITLLILEIKVPPTDGAALGSELAHLWPSFLAFLSSFLTIGIMWINHHRLFTLIHKSDEGLTVYNLLLLLGVTWVPFPTALVAEHLRGEDGVTAGVLYASSFTTIALIYNLMWRHVVKKKLCGEHLDVDAISRQYLAGPILYAALIGIAFINGTAVLVASTLIALYFVIPPSLWRRKAQ